MTTRNPFALNAQRKPVGRPIALVLFVLQKCPFAIHAGTSNDLSLHGMHRASGGLSRRTDAQRAIPAVRTNAASFLEPRCYACIRFAPGAPTSSSEDYSSAMLASYISQGKTARFRIELGPGKKDDSSGQEPGEPSVTIGTGRFVREQGSDASILLGDLKKALLAKSLPSKVQRVPSVPFTFVSFGDRLSLAPGGGMHTNPPGNWTAMKLFLGEGQNESQVILNLDPTEGKGQFSIKDTDYGDLLLVEFAKVF